MSAMDVGSIMRSWRLPCSVATVATERGAVCRPGMWTTLRRTCTRTSRRAFLVNHLHKLRKQQGGTGGAIPPQREVRRACPPRVPRRYRISTIVETRCILRTNENFCDKISVMNQKPMTRRDRGFGVRPCPVRWQPWQRSEVRFVVLECEQPCDEREPEHRGEPILSMTERITKSTPFPYTAGR